MKASKLYHHLQRYRTLKTDRIHALPIAILMPHSACNCRCVMCDIWKDNKNLKQLTEADVRGLLDSFQSLGTRQVVMSGGEALLNDKFFALCDILQRHHINISLLSTGLSLERHAATLLTKVNDIIISLDGDEALHNEIRNIPNAYQKLYAGVHAIHDLQPDFPVSGRTVIHRLNFRKWSAIIKSAHDLGLQHISFLPADISSQAFNRETIWEPARQEEIQLGKEELPELQAVIDEILIDSQQDIQSGFIRESATKLQQIHTHYAAYYGLTEYPVKKCNAPWVSAVVEADGSVKPCFFHATQGNIRDASLESIVNQPSAIQFRKTLDMEKNPTCKKCVCSLQLSPWTSVG